MEAPPRGEATPKRKAPPLRVARLPAPELPHHRAPIGVAEPSHLSLQPPQREPASLSPWEREEDRGQQQHQRLRLGSAAALAVAPARGGNGSTSPRRRLDSRPGGIVPPGSPLPLPSQSAALLAADAAGTPKRLPALRRPSSVGDHAATLERPRQPSQSTQSTDDHGRLSAEAEALLSSKRYGAEHEQYGVEYEQYDAEYEPYGVEYGEMPKRLSPRIHSAVILRPVLEGDHVEYEVETQFSLDDHSEQQPAPARALGSAPQPEREVEPERRSQSDGTGRAVRTSVVMRRYSKFEVLRKLIIKQFPGLPKLPKKGLRRHAGVEKFAELERKGESQSLADLRKSTSETDPRVAGLNAFLAALIATEGASEDEYVQQFLGVSELDIVEGENGEAQFNDGLEEPYEPPRARSTTNDKWRSAAHHASLARTWIKEPADTHDGSNDGRHADADLVRSQVMARSPTEGNLFESDYRLSRRSSSYVPREQRNIAEHTVHSVAKYAGRGIEVVGIARRSAPPSVPRRVRDMLGVDESALGADGSFQHMHRADAASLQYLAEAMQAQRTTVSGDANAEVVKVVDLWSCYVKLERNGEGHFATFMLFAVYWVLLMMVFFDGPSSSWSLAQSEAISDLLFDEEFEDANYKKNWHEVMTAEELYTWIEGPLTNALYDVELGQNTSLLGGSTQLVGQVEFRQARSTAGNGPAGCANEPASTNCPTEFGEFGEVTGSLVPGGRCASTWHIPEYVSLLESVSHTQLDWAEPLYRGGTGGLGCNHQDESGRGAGGAEEPQSQRPERQFGQDFRWRKHSHPLEGSRSFVRKPMGAINPLAGKPYNYGTGTYSTTWPRDYRAWTEKLAAMRGEGGLVPLIDQHTRALAISMVLYNGNSFSHSRLNSSATGDVGAFEHRDGLKDLVNSDQLIYVQAFVEIDPGGHFEKHTKVLPIRPMRAISDPAEYDNRWLRRTTHDIFGRFLWREDAYSGGFLLLALLTLLVEVRKIVSEGLRGYFILSSTAAWNKFEIFVWCVLFATFIQGRSFQTVSDAVLGQLAEVEVGVHAHELSSVAGVEASHVLIDRVADLRIEEISLRRHVAWLLFLSTLKVMKFMNLSERLSFLWRVLGHAKVELTAFLGIFLVLLSSFALLATTLMGYHSRTLHNVPTAMLSLLRLTVGTFDLDYDEWHRADPLWAPVLLVSFIFLLILVAANIFIAILTDAYSTKKAQIAKYTRFKKLLRKEGVLLTSNSAAGMLKRFYRTLFPHWRLQVPPTLWPRPQTVDVQPTYKIHQSAQDHGADVITLHFHHESIVGGDPDATLAKVGEAYHGTGKTSSDISTKADRRINLLAQSNKQVGITLASAAEVLSAEEEEQQDRAHPLSARNALFTSQRACYLQLAQDLYMEDLPLLIALMRPGEVVELRGSGQMHGNRSRIKLEMLEVYTRKRTIPRVGGEPEHSKDWYANFRVVDVKSWESFTVDKSTQLLLDTNGWTAQQDRLILDNMRLKRQYERARDKAAEAGDASVPAVLNGKRPQSVAKLAEQLGKTVDEVRSRQQFVKRCAAAGLSPPPILASTLHWSTKTSLKLWYRAWMNDDLPHYSIAGYVLPRLHKIFLTKSGVERDVDDFLRGRIEELKRKHNMRDLENVRRSFTKRSIDVDEFANHLQLFLYTTRRRTLAYLRQTYSNPMYTRWLLVYLQTEYKEQIVSVRRKKRRDIPTPPPY